MDSAEDILALPISEDWVFKRIDFVVTWIASFTTRKTPPRSLERDMSQSLFPDDIVYIS